MASERVKQLVSHLSSSSSQLAALERKDPNDVVITLAVRTPLCMARKGALKDTRADELLTEILRAAVAHSNMDPKFIEDICVGTSLLPAPNPEVRAASLAAGIPEETPIQTINRYCSSGLMALTSVSNQIRAGQITVGLAVGVESMTQSPGLEAAPASDEIMNHITARDCMKPMGWTSENLAEDFDVTREDMDYLAVLSFQRAENAQKSGRFDAEIVPIQAFVRDQATGKRTRSLIGRDDGIRSGATKASLSKIRPAFPQWGMGRTTGGNASQITDGAAAVLMMTRRKADELGLKILGKHVTTTVTGLAPRIMGIGPSVAIPKLLNNAGLDVKDIDLFEINEAFASMYVYCVRELGLDIDKVNVNGGAIALGHPVGARQVATGLHELERRNGKLLVTAMCIGTGMGAAALFARD